MKRMFSSHLAALPHVTGPWSSVSRSMLRDCLKIFLKIQPVGSFTFSSFVCLILGTCVVAGGSSWWKIRELCGTSCWFYYTENWQVGSEEVNFFPRKKWASIVLNPLDCTSLLLRAKSHTGEYFCSGPLFAVLGSISHVNQQNWVGRIAIGILLGLK